MEHQLISKDLTVKINFFGAEISSIKNKSGIEFIWQANKEVWPRHAPVLFPIVGKLKDNTFIFEGKDRTLSQHGFARDGVFELINNDSASCTFQLVSDDESKKIFPFDFVFQITYRLEQNKLITSYNISNPSEKPLFASVGAHPGFNCPLLPKEKMEDYYLEFEQPEYKLTELSNGLRTNRSRQLEMFENKLFLSEQLFENDALVFENNQINKVSLCSSKSAHKITLECGGWPYFGIWSKTGSNFKQKFICLEPWYGIADREDTNQDFSQKEGILKIGAKESFSCSFSITIE